MIYVIVSNLKSYEICNESKPHHTGFASIVSSCYEEMNITKGNGYNFLENISTVEDTKS